MTADAAPSALKRRIGPWLLTAYGVGVMVGAGIYVLVGAVVAQAGIWAPLSFLLAGLIAAPTALSYAELSTRIPEAGGEAAYVATGLNSDRLAMAVGLAIVLAGIVSAAAVLRGGVGYLQVVMDVPAVWAIIALGVLLTLVAIIGAVESLSVAAVFTAVELAGLGLVIWAGWWAEPVAAYSAPPAIAWSAVGVGAVLAFFAFIGFEDIVNMAEETRNPSRTLPIAIIVSLALTTAIYALVTWAAVRAVPSDLLAGSEQPLALVWSGEDAARDARLLSAIAVVAALNGILAQIVMASRVLFGMGRLGRAFAPLQRVHRRFGTPVLATVLVGAAIIAGALALPVATLAGATSVILLSVFVVINITLIVLKRRVPEAPFKVPMATPVIGAVLAAGALLFSVGGMV